MDTILKCPSRGRRQEEGVASWTYSTENPASLTSKCEFAYGGIVEESVFFNQTRNTKAELGPPRNLPDRKNKVTVRIR